MIEWFENKSVAVVGNAKSLFEHQYGTLIDSHDVVCRINKGALIVNEISQGMKTDVFVFAGFKKFKHLLDIVKTDKRLFTSPRKQEEALKISNLTCYPVEWRNRLKETLISYDSSFINHKELPGPGEKGEIKKPSAGICLLDYVSRFNPHNVSIFGFDWKETPTYYELMGGSKTAHDYKYEKYHCLEHFSKKLGYIFYT